MISSAAALLDSLFEHPAGTHYEERVDGVLSRTGGEPTLFRSEPLQSRAILDGQHDQVPVSNRIDNPIAVLANPIEMVHTVELRETRGMRTGAENMEPLHEKHPQRFGDCAELLLSRRGQENGGD